MWLLVVQSDLSWALRVDIATPDSHTWRGVCYLNLDRAFQRKVQESGMYRLRADDIVLIQLCRDIMGQFELRTKYRSAIRSIYADNPRSIEAELDEIFGRRCAGTLSEVCRKGSFEDLRVLGKQMRRAVIVRGLMREPLGTTGNILRYLGWRCREYVRPNGVMVAVIGPDGSGKGTLIEKVKTLYNWATPLPNPGVPFAAGTLTQPRLPATGPEGRRRSCNQSTCKSTERLDLKFASPCLPHVGLRSWILVAGSSLPWAKMHCGDIRQILL